MWNSVKWGGAMKGRQSLGKKDILSVPMSNDPLLKTPSQEL